MAKDINEQSFDDATKLKLKIFGECFKEWLPVFVHDPFTREVHIYDFFAGSGMDKDGCFGSPLILLDTARGENRKYCGKTGKTITFTFNEGLKKKSLQLEQSVENHLRSCQEKNNCEKCVYRRQIIQSDFRSIFQDASIQNILNNKHYGKFLSTRQKFDSPDKISSFCREIQHNGS